MIAMMLDIPDWLGVAAAVRVAEATDTPTSPPWPPWWSMDGIPKKDFLKFIS